MRELKVSSSAFVNEGWIPDCCSAYHENKSPELTIEGIVEEAVSMVVMTDDADHPIVPHFNHWIAWNIPPVRVIPEKIPKGAKVESPISMEQGRAYGRHCYKGPKPPFSSTHEYIFTVYVLDCMLEISERSRKKDVLKNMEGHILQKGVLKGKYQECKRN